ncbi:hypothetical protein [Phenylobacterium sp. SCN 70-31]|uniref:hypothetical protein n=1 Tax=Phenylobacterium sp. SCN 70-31 TaxID=1660129 RepID=UPI00086E3BE9|nr:hypothetical protein [Phenylobacterium sp. SCN 70-31]ODT88500.1 MAG: hypothetical protein ABS78_07775 [Phenylobacterium sp. SCN 70-31]
MSAGLKQVLVSPITSSISIALAVALATALGISSGAWQSERAGYRQRIAELTRAADRAEAGLRSELAACHAKQVARDALEAEFAARGTTVADEARRLLAQQPEGIDACARMESADRAVLSNLKK